MATINESIQQFKAIDINVNPMQQFIPSDACFSWCLEQQVVHSNNLELYAVGLVLMSYIFILLYDMDSIEILQKYRSELIYMAKLMLIVFFVVYILVIRLRIYY